MKPIKRLYYLTIIFYIMWLNFLYISIIFILFYLYVNYKFCLNKYIIDWLIYYIKFAKLGNLISLYGYYIFKLLTWEESFI